MILHANTNQKRAEVSILKSDKIGFKSKKITSDNEGHYINKRYNTARRYYNCKHLHNDRRSKYMKQRMTEWKGERALQQQMETSTSHSQ